jgi:hypothetical protein
VGLLTLTISGGLKLAHNNSRTAQYFDTVQTSMAEFQATSVSDLKERRFTEIFNKILGEVKFQQHHSSTRISAIDARATVSVQRIAREG